MLPTNHEADLVVTAGSTRALGCRCRSCYAPNLFYKHRDCIGLHRHQASFRPSSSAARACSRTWEAAVSSRMLAQRLSGPCRSRCRPLDLLARGKPSRQAQSRLGALAKQNHTPHSCSLVLCVAVACVRRCAPLPCPAFPCFPCCPRRAAQAASSALSNSACQDKSLATGSAAALVVGRAARMLSLLPATSCANPAMGRHRLLRCSPRVLQVPRGAAAAAKAAAAKAEAAEAAAAANKSEAAGKAVLLLPRLLVGVGVGVVAEGSRDRVLRARRPHCGRVRPGRC